MTAHARGPSLGSRSPTTGPRLDVESQRGSRGQPPAVLLSPEHGGLYLRRRRRPAAAGSPRSTSRRPPRPCHDTAVCRARRLQSGQREPAARRGPHTVRLPGSAGPGPESALGADGQGRAGSPGAEPTAAFPAPLPSRGDPRSSPERGLCRAASRTLREQGGTLAGRAPTGYGLPGARAGRAAPTPPASSSDPLGLHSRRPKSPSVLPPWPTHPRPLQAGHPLAPPGRASHAPRRGFRGFQGLSALPPPPGL